jgi:hypothetical protein
MKTAIACSLLCLVAVSAFAQPLTPPVRVCVWTAKPDLVGPDQQGRENSVTDLLKVLSGSRYKRMLATAATKEASDIQVEVTTRGAINTRGRYQPIDPLGKKSHSADDELTLFATLRFGDYRVDLTCSAGANNMFWRRTAQVCADKILDWTQARVGQVRPTK